MKTTRSTYVDSQEYLNFVENGKIAYSFGITKRFRQHYATIRNKWNKHKVDLDGLIEWFNPIANG